MIIFIDGYNVLKQQLDAKYVSDKERYAFVKKIARYHARTRHTIVVVFDGGDGRYPYRERHHGIEVAYAGSLISADHYIQQELTKLKGREIVLVSNDRELCASAHDVGAVCIDSDLFYAKMMQPAVKSPAKKGSISIIKMDSSGESLDQIDELMESAALMSMADKDRPEVGDDAPRHHPPRKNKISKRERALLNIWDKL
jgi:predicted RNA-binding protein with PIN domain